MKKTIIALFLICIIFVLPSCSRNVKYEFMHDTSEIASIEIVKLLDYDSENSRYKEMVLSTVENTDVFLQDFLKIDCEKIFNDPDRVGTNMVVIKITYANGNYELINYIAQSRRFFDVQRASEGPYILDKEQFEAFIEKYYTEELPTD